MIKISLHPVSIPQTLIILEQDVWLEFSAKAHMSI